jgi:hypothetical protein
MTEFEKKLREALAILEQTTKGAEKGSTKGTTQGATAGALGDDDDKKKKRKSKPD